MPIFGPPDVRKMKSKKNIKGLIKALRYKKYADVRKYAATFLGDIGDPSAVEPLAAALKDDDVWVRYYAAKALAKFGDPRSVEPLITALNDNIGDMAQHAAEILGEIGDPRAVETLIAAFKNEYLQVPGIALEALLKIGDSSVMPLIASLKDDSKKVRMYAAETLGKINDPRAVEPLIASLKDDSKKVRMYAAEALGKINDPRAVEPLIAAFKDDNRGVRINVVKALEKIGDPAGKPIIAAHNTDERKYDVIALRKRGGKSTVEPLIAALKDDNEDVRMWAAVALGEIVGDKRAVEPLTTALKDNSEVVRRYAAEALEKIQSPVSERWDQTVENMVHKDFSNQDFKNAAAELRNGPNTKKAVNTLIWYVLEHPQIEVKISAAKGLGLLGDQSAAIPLIELYQKVINIPDYQGITYRDAVRLALDELGWGFRVGSEGWVKIK